MAPFIFQEKAHCQILYILGVSPSGSRLEHPHLLYPAHRKFTPISWPDHIVFLCVCLHVIPFPWNTLSASSSFPLVSVGSSQKQMLRWHSKHKTTLTPCQAHWFPQWLWRPSLAFSGQGPELPDVQQCSGRSFAMKKLSWYFTWFPNFPLDVPGRESPAYNFLSPEPNLILHTGIFQGFHYTSNFLGRTLTLYVKEWPHFTDVVQNLTKKNPSGHPCHWQHRHACAGTALAAVIFSAVKCFLVSILLFLLV